jgi:hypothetical protein
VFVPPVVLDTTVLLYALPMVADGRGLVAMNKTFPPVGATAEVVTFEVEFDVPIVMTDEVVNV